MGSLRIGVNALYLIPGAVGGTQIYLEHLLDALSRVDRENEYVVFLNAETTSAGVPFPPGFALVNTGVRAAFRPARILWEQAVFPNVLAKHRIDVLFNPGFTAPVFSGKPNVTVFHDLQHKRHPEFFRFLDLPFWRLLLWAAAMRSHRLIAVSQATADDIARYYPRAASKTAVVPHGVDNEFFRIGHQRQTRAPSEDKFILTVSTLHPHKNIHRLLEAFARFRRAHPEYGLVVAGFRGFASEELESARQALRLSGCVTFTGWIAREELYRLFGSASAYVAPSEFEGFGMPVAEALAAGIPTACSDIPPFRAISGGAAAYFNPFLVDEIANALELITTDTTWRERATSEGPRRAALFDWDRAAAMTLEVIREAA